jgi:hypothetical protein
MFLLIVATALGLAIPVLTLVTIGWEKWMAARHASGSR